jgi:hypothetical protein
MDCGDERGIKGEGRRELHLELPAGVVNDVVVVGGFVVTEDANEDDGGDHSQYGADDDGWGRRLDFVRASLAADVRDDMPTASTGLPNGTTRKERTTNAKAEVRPSITGLTIRQ